MNKFNKPVIMSKTTFKTMSGALKAAAKAGKTVLDLHTLPSGRFCYVFEATI